MNRWTWDRCPKFDVLRAVDWAVPRIMVVVILGAAVLYLWRKR